MSLPQNSLLPRSNFEVLLGDSTYLLPKRGASDFLLYDPVGGYVLDVTAAQAGILRAQAHDPVRLNTLLRALTGASRKRVVPKASADAYSPTTVALMLTSACQLRCSYCYAEAGDTKTQHLSSEIARKAITIVARNASQTEQRQFTVHLHGAGEPTLMPGTIASLLDHISVEETHWSTICRKIMSSNFCVPPQQAVSYARSLTQIFVSSDGPPDIADAFRPMAKKGGSSGAILENALAAVYGAQLSDKITIRCTVSSATQRRLCEITRYFSQFGIRKIYFVPVSSLGRGQDSLAIAADVFVEEFRKCGRVAESLGVSIYYPGTDLSRARLDGYACGIKGSNFAVLPDGTVSVCYEAVVPGSELREAYRIGTLSSEGLRVDESRVQQIAHSTHVSQRAACNTCFCRLTCAGQCAARNVAPGINKRDLPMTDACDITRALTQAAIEDL